MTTPEPTYSEALDQIATLHHQIMVAEHFEPRLGELGGEILDKLHHDLPLGPVADRDLGIALRQLPMLDNAQILAAWTVLAERDA